MPNKIKFLVTGGAGFIGSHVTDLLLENGYLVNVVDNLYSGSLKNLEINLKNSNLNFYQNDISEIELNHKCFQEVNFIIHLAGLGDIVPSINSPLDYFKINCYGTSRIMEAAKRNKIQRVVYAASSSCYGNAAIPTRETDEINPLHPYAFTKYIGELSAFHWSRVYGVEVNSIRIFNAYGPRSKTTSNYGAMFGVFMKQLIEGEPLTIVGDGNQTRDFVYVTDVAKAFLLAATSNVHGEIFNVGSGNPRSVNEVANMLSQSRAFTPERPGEPKVTWANISKIHNMLGWQPQVTLENGIAKMLHNIEFWKDAPLWTKEKINLATSDWFKYLGQKITDDQI